MMAVQSIAMRLLRLALPLAALLLATACATMPRQDPVQVYVVGIEPLQGEGLELRMNVKLRVQNPNDIPIDYNGVSVAMDVQGKRFASGVSNATGTVPRFGESVIDVPVSVSALKAMRGAFEIFGGNHTDKLQYELNGKLAGKLFSSVRFSSKGEFTIPKDVYSTDQP